MLSRFTESEHGAVLPMAAMILLLVAGASAGAVEYTKFSEMRKQAQNLVDSAAIIGATRSEKAAEAFVRSRFEEIENDGSRIEILNVKVDDVARVELKFVASTMFERLGLGDTPITVSATAAPPTRKSVDVVLTLDYSGSMAWDDRYLHMAKAANSFLDTFPDTGGAVRVGMVPFGSYTLMTVDGRYLYDSLSGSSLIGSDYLACVSNRGYPHAVQVATPNSTVEASLWPAIDFAQMNANSADDDWATANPDAFGTPPPWNYDDPDDAVYTAKDVMGEPGYEVDWTEPDGTSNGYSWTVSWDGKCTYESAWRLGYCSQYASTSNADTPTGESFSSGDLEAHAAAENLAPACKSYFDRKLATRALSSDLKGLKADISTMSPSGATNIALAFDTAWHVVSDNQPWTEHASSPDAKKIVILLSDGVQTVPALGSGNEFSVSAANRNTEEICMSMKEADVTVYTIAFGVDDAFTNDLLAGCATSLSHFFKPRISDSLETVFLDIAQSLSTRTRIIN